MFKRNKQITEEPDSAKIHLLDRAVAGFVSKLPEKDFPNESQFREAQNTAASVFQETLANEKFLNEAVSTGEDLKSKSGLIKLELSTWMENHPLPLPAPTFNERLNGFKLAFAVVVGTFIGALLLSGLFNFLTDDPNTGYALGMLIGAGGTVLLMWYASENKKVRRYLQGALGVATAAEVAILFGKFSGIGAIWSALRVGIPGVGLLRLLKRFFLYISVVFILRMSVRRPEFDRPAYQKNVRIMFDAWLNHALDFLKSLLEQTESKAPKSILGKTLIPKELGRCLHKIHQSSAEVLPEAAAEVLLIARNIGLEGVEGEPAFINGQPEKPQQFTWEKSLEEKYRMLGVVEDGDQVFVEAQPVIQEGEVIEKGTVRKVRKR